MGWGDSWEKVPKPFGQVMKEFNEDAADKITKSGQENLQVLFEAKSVILQIPIKGGWQTRTINAIQIGDLAVCFDNEDEEIGLVTHVPTLTRFDNAIPDGEWTQEQLIRWCWKVQQKFKEAFNYLNALNNSTYKTADESALNIIKTNCLSVGVE